MVNVGDGGDDTGGNDKVMGNGFVGVHVTGGNVTEGGKEVDEVQANGGGKVHEKVSTNSYVYCRSSKSPKDTTPSPPVPTGMLITTTTNTLTLNSASSPSSGLSPVVNPRCVYFIDEAYLVRHTQSFDSRGASLHSTSGDGASFPSRIGGWICVLLHVIPFHSRVFFQICYKLVLSNFTSISLLSHTQVPPLSCRNFSSPAYGHVLGVRRR
jgi:hypothetical protein